MVRNRCKDGVGGEMLGNVVRGVSVVNPRAAAVAGVAATELQLPAARSRRLTAL
jgi:hypothetical protein